MKKLLLSIVAIAALSFSVNAQDAQSPDEKAEAVVEQAAESHDLTQEESNLLVEVLADYYVQMKYAADDDPGDGELIREIEQNRNNKIKEIFGHERAEEILGFIAEK